IVIVRFDGTWSKEEEKTVLAGFLAMLGRKENPLLVVYKPREKKSLLLSLGFTERIYEGKTHLAFRQMK
ncbi:MAG: hypothetical protein HUJ60_05470, partial [Bacilli bacterium]|nr:hypothetical protein [Bacilli bacterium]